MPAGLEAKGGRRRHGRPVQSRLRLARHRCTLPAGGGPYCPKPRWL